MSSLALKPMLNIFEIDGFWDDVVRNHKGKFFTDPNSFPPVQEKKTDSGIIYQLALAGYNKDDLKITATEDQITVESSKSTVKENLFASRSFKWGRYDPHGLLDFTKCEVTFSNGLLTLDVPKKPSKQPKLLEVKAKNT